MLRECEKPGKSEYVVKMLLQKFSTFSRSSQQPAGGVADMHEPIRLV